MNQTTYQMGRNTELLGNILLKSIWLLSRFDDLFDLFGGQVFAETLFELSA